MQELYEANYGITDKIPVTFQGYQKTLNGPDIILVTEKYPIFKVPRTWEYNPIVHIIVDFEKL